MPPMTTNSVLSSIMHFTLLSFDFVPHHFDVSIVGKTTHCDPKIGTPMFSIEGIASNLEELNL